MVSGWDLYSTTEEIMCAVPFCTSSLTKADTSQLILCGSSYLQPDKRKSRVNRTVGQYWMMIKPFNRDLIFVRCQVGVCGSDGPCAQWVSSQVVWTSLLCHCNQRLAIKCNSSLPHTTG